MTDIHTILKRVILAKLLLKMILFAPVCLNQEKMMPKMNLKSPAAYYETQKKSFYEPKKDYYLKQAYSNRCDADAMPGELEGKLTPDKAYIAKPALNPASQYIISNR